MTEACPSSFYYLVFYIFASADQSSWQLQQTQRHRRLWMNRSQSSKWGCYSSHCSIVCLTFYHHHRGTRSTCLGHQNTWLDVAERRWQAIHWLPLLLQLWAPKGEKDETWKHNAICAFILEIGFTAAYDCSFLIYNMFFIIGARDLLF